jgi:uncharacterized Zn finger protein
MGTTLSLTEATIRQMASPEVFERGMEYYRRGAVLDVTRRGDELYAEVEGSDVDPYQVRVSLRSDGIGSADCTCPYDWGGACKHVVAVLLTCLHDAEHVEERPPLAALLTGLDAQQLQSILLALAEREPGLIERIERQVLAAQRPPAGGAPTDQPEASPLAPARESHLLPPDAGAIRRQLRAALREVDRRDDDDEYWEEDDALAEVHEVLDEVSPYLEAGDGRAAMILLAAMTEEYLARWPAPYGDYSLGAEFFRSLGELWIEAILSAELTPAEREDLEKRLAGWQADAEEYSHERALDAARTAARQGWDDPALLRVLQGEITEKGAWDGEAPDYADDLAVARLNVLERQGRHQEYLYLAEAEGQTECYLQKLVQLGRIQEAVDYGLEHLTTAEQCLALAQALRERGATDAALRIAEHGLEMPLPDSPHAAHRRRAPLARWLRDEARALDRTEQALKAGRILLEEEPGLAEYRAVEALAGECWPALREELLAHLRERASFYPKPQIDIFLHEGRIEDAIAALAGTSNDDLVAQVANAAVSTHPQWVIKASRAQAEAIMDAGKATAYAHAVEWLEWARRAYRVAGREADWRAYLEDLLTTHQRKHKLVPMLKALRQGSGQEDRVRSRSLNPR